ncbi:MAG: radical SAM family heme chaperone HemW, partial [Clostridia bacterium]|nr:radical SAM family heme chaperone HemW [Clostridia bacterium]
LYIHLPFCVRKCAYCDFCSFAGVDGSIISEYADALASEILSYREREIKVDTLFFGGGTPSLLSPEDFRKIMRAVRESFLLSDEAEITLEANPKTLDRKKIESFVSSGINRISLGLQSIHENELKTLGRIHSYSEFLETYRLCREAGIDNVNVDLMYGLPGQTVESFKETLCAVIDLSPEHISVYGLILEEGTPLYEKQSRLSFPSEDCEYEMYLLADRLLSRAGYSHYEISNYSRAGKESRHNLKYWRCEEYIGVGVSAHSYLDGYRFGRTQSLTEYLRGNREYLNKEYIDRDGEALEKIMLGLRLREGISLKEYEDLFGFDLTEKYREKLITLEKMGYVRIFSGRLSLTAEGFYLSNYIINELTEST